MKKRAVALFLCLSMLLSFTPTFATEDFAMRHIEFTANTNGTTLNGVATLQFLFNPDDTLKEQLDVSNVGTGVQDVYDERMTVSFVLKLVDSPAVTTVREFRQSYEQITVTNVPASPNTVMLADGRFALRIRPEDMVLHSPELTEWAKTHPNWPSELGSYARTDCYAGTAQIVAHYDRDGITPAAAAACEDCQIYTEQIISCADEGFSLSDTSKWTLTNTWPGYNGSIPTYYGNTEGQYAQYKPKNLEEGWYDVYFWNMKCYEQQNPVKMTATVYANGITYTTIPLAVTTATVDKEGTWTKVGTYYFKGTNDEYLRLVSNGGTNARPADAKFVKNDSYQAPEKVTSCHITTTSMGFTKAGTWVAANFADSTGNTTSGVSYYGETLGSYAQYMPYNLEPGWYDISFWNIKYDNHQDPMKMTGTVYSNGEFTELIQLGVSTATENGKGAWTKVGTYYFDGSDTEYFRLVSTYEGTTSRPSDVKFEKNENYTPPRVTEQEIGYGDSKLSLSNASAWYATDWPSTGNTMWHYWGYTKDAYVQYTPQYLEPGWYKIYFWNMKCYDQQNPVKMTGTVYSNGETTANIALETTTATTEGDGTWTPVGTYYFTGSNDEYFRLVATGESNARPASVRFVKDETYVPPVTTVTEQEIGYGDSGLSLSNASAWNATNWPSAENSMWHYWGYTFGEYVQYTPKNLEEGWYDIYFWNMKCYDQQNPVKMTGTVYSNNRTTSNIALATTTATTEGDGTWTPVGTYYFKGTNDEYFRLVSTGKSNARPANVRFMKNNDFVPPPSLGNETVTVSEENGSWIAEAAEGTYTLTIDVETANDYGQLALYVNDVLVDKQYSGFDKTGTHTFGTYTFNQYDELELKYTSYTTDTTCPVGDIHYAPAKNQYVQYKLFNKQREEYAYFFEAGVHEVQATVTNNTGSDKTYQLYVTLTDSEDFVNRPDGNITKMTAMKEAAMSEAVTVKNGESAVLSAALPIEKLNADTKLKALIWNGTATMVPQFEAKIYEPATDIQSESFSITPASCQDMGTWSALAYNGAISGWVFSGTTHNKPETTSPAVSTFSAVPGEYKVWVRTKNFTDRPELRHFNIEVNGTTLSKTFGQVGLDGFYWEDAGTVELDGKTTVKLLDTSAQYAKCDTIVFTRDLTTNPPDSLEQLNAFSPAVKAIVSEMNKDDMMTDFTMDQNFEGGNYLLNYMGNDVVEFSPDLRDTDGTWFYWNFKATSEKDRTVTFKLSGCDVLIGNSGVLYSTDDGETWNYMSDTAKGTEFSYDFEAGKTVWFSCVMPYQVSHLNTYLDNIKDLDNVSVSTLCESEEGRDVPLIVVGNEDAPKAVFFTARHHSCESTASYMLEGVVNYLIEASKTSSLFDDYCFYIVPMVDIDGVENGDQGKNRMPHDHNRDYVNTIYAPVKGIMALAQTLDVEFAMDIHCPYLQDYGPYFAYDPAVEDAVLALHEMLIEASDKNTDPDKIVYKDGWNRPASINEKAQMKGWFNIEMGAPFSATLEFPYSGDVGDEYTPERMIDFGVFTGEVIENYLLNTAE